MCGINLIVDKKSLLSNHNIEMMNKATQHRGPDFQQFKQFQCNTFRLFMAHSRLKIIDLSDDANQPMSDDTNRYHLIYNGEIYNYYQLKNQLIDDGCQFKTSSDTEVLLQWLIQKGKTGISQLQGMFSFVLFDLVKQRIICGRDPFGMKPFFYYEDQRCLIISSEIKGILASGLYQKQLNQGQILQYLNFRHASYPETFYKDVFELSPGHSFIWTPTEETEVASSNFFKGLTSECLEEETLVARVEEKLIDAVGQHLLADVPVGIFLSGGIDSTLLLALLQRHYGNQYNTFSIGHRQNEKSFGTKDGYFAPLAARQYGASHEVITVGAEILQHYDEYMSSIDQPIGDSASLLTLALSKEASKTVGVVWSGAGADEWLAGYNRHYAFYQYLKHYQSLKNFSAPIKNISQFLPTGWNHPWRKKFQLWKKFGTGLSENPTKTYRNFTSFRLEHENSVFDDWEELVKDKSFVDHHLGKALSYDRQQYLISDILALSDRMTMQHGLEMRMPYLSYELVELLHKVPPSALIKNGRKWVLSTLLERYGGKQFTARKKEGFGIPFGNWLRAGKANHLLDFFDNKNCVIFEYLDKGYIQAQLQDHNQRKADNTLFLWSFIQLGKWLQINFN